MTQLMGCPDDILLILAETAELAQWKAHEAQNGMLDMNVLLMRASEIENRVLVSTIAQSAMPLSFASLAGAAAGAATTESHMHPTHPSGEHSALTPEQAELLPGQSAAVQSHVGASGATSSSGGLTPEQVATGLPMAMSLGTPSISVSSPSGGSNSPTSNQKSQNLAKQVSQVFLHTAGLYLASVVNDTNPGSSYFRFGTFFVS